MPQPPLNPIAFHSVANCLGDHKTYSTAGVLISTRTPVHDDTGRTSASTATKNCGEVSGSTQPSRRGQHETGSASQPNAALAPTRTQNRAPGTSAHPKAKTVGAAAPTVTRLKRTLAHSEDSLEKLGLRYARGCRGKAARHKRRPSNDTREPGQNTNCGPRFAGNRLTSLTPSTRHAGNQRIRLHTGPRLH